MGFFALKFYLLGSVKLADVSDSFCFAADVNEKSPQGREIQSPAGQDCFTGPEPALLSLFGKISKNKS